MKKYFVKKAAALGLMLCFLACTCLAAACGSSSDGIYYTLSFEGTIEEPGVLEFLSYSINVYQDEASNPCGDCADQPVHLYVGDDAAAAVSAVAELIERSDDLWEVSDKASDLITLKYRVDAAEADYGTLSTVPGLSLQASVNQNGSAFSIDASVQTAASDTAVESVDAERIAAIYGPSYEMLTALGVEDKIVVRADVQTDGFPWASELFSRIDEVPFLEDVHSSVNFEELMTYSPDLVFTFPRQNELSLLSKSGIPYVAGISYVDIDDTCELLTSYAQALGGDAPEKAAAYCSYFNEKLSYVASIVENVPEEKRPVVYYAGMDILTTYGNKSDMVALIEAAGGKAAMAELDAGSRTEINYEQLIAWSPDYIFLDHGSINDGVSVEDMQAGLYSGKAYVSLPAVQNENVYTVPSGVFYWDMGLQKALLVEYIAKTLYPSLFADLDMANELIEFYDTIYGIDLTRSQAEAILARELP